MLPVVLRTERLTLSVPVATDAAAIVDACQDPEVQRLTRVPSPYSRHDAEEFIRAAATGWAEGTQAVWALRHDGVLAGMVGLHDLSGGERELGYWLAPGHRGAGLMTEAARAVVDWGFRGPLRLARIEWRAAVGNAGSAHVARRLGFTYAGLLRRAFVNGAGVRADAWVADLLPNDPRTPRDWPI